MKKIIILLICIIVLFPIFSKDPDPRKIILNLIKKINEEYGIKLPDWNNITIATRFEFEHKRISVKDFLNKPSKNLSGILLFEIRLIYSFARTPIFFL